MGACLSGQGLTRYIMGHPTFTNPNKKAAGKGGKPGSFATRNKDYF
jgi:hypothetical protein